MRFITNLPCFVSVNFFRGLHVANLCTRKPNKQSTMQSKLFQILMFVLAAICLASCKKEVISPAPELKAAADAPSFIINPLPKKRLATIASLGQPVATFTYDGSGRLAKVVGPEQTTTYSYANGMLSIKRFLNAYPAVLRLDLSGPLNTKGQVTSLKGKIESGYYLVDASFDFQYDAMNRLVQYKWKSTHPGGYIYDHTFILNWKDGNVASTQYFSGANLVQTNIYTYDLAQPDRRGVWDEIHAIWADKFFGTRNKNLCTKVVTKNYNHVVTHTVSQLWKLDADNYPVTQSLFYTPTNTSETLDYLFSESLVRQ
jgi:hypothetical protein